MGREGTVSALVHRGDIGLKILGLRLALGQHHSKQTVA